jgi:hypothetical protein
MLAHENKNKVKSQQACQHLARYKPILSWRVLKQLSDHALAIPHQTHIVTVCVHTSNVHKYIGIA